MEVIIRDSREIFNDLVCFEKEVANPRVIKSELDKLVERLNKNAVGHKNRVITNVIKRDNVKKTVTMKINVEVRDKTNIDNVLDRYPQYQYLPQYIIKEGYLISISNNMEDFNKAIHMLMKQVKKDFNIEEYDFSKNSLIEVSKIGYDGSVLGFDLFLEKEDVEVN